MLHHRLGLHKGRRYWLRGPSQIHDSQAQCHLHCNTASPNIYSSHTTTPGTPIPGHTLQWIPSWARPGVTIISSPATTHTTPPFCHTSALLEPSQAFYMPATVLSPPTAAAPAVLLQYKDHFSTICVWSAKLPDRLHTQGTFLCLLC